MNHTKRHSIDRLTRLALAKLLICTAAVIPVAYAQFGGPPTFAFPVVPVMFVNGDVRLVGGLLVPDTKGKVPDRFPAVVMIHGAGSATFDEPAFRVHANAFVRAGFAVLLFDKRGSGKSTGDLDNTDYDGLVGDDAASVRFLRARADISPNKVGLFGRSKGGWIGTIAASRDPGIAFVIMSSGSAVVPYAQTLFSTRNALRARGASPDEIEKAANAKAALWGYYREVANDNAWGRSEKGLAARDAVEKGLQSFARFVPEIPEQVAHPATKSPAFFRAFTSKIYFEPVQSFRALRAPLLEIIGDKDDVVEPASAIAELDRLRRLGLNVTVRTLPNVDHTLLVKSAEGPRYPDDYPEFAVRWAQEQVDRIVERPR